MSDVLLEARAVSRTYHPKGRAPVEALRDVSIAVGPRQTVGLVGESGSGKTTLMRLLLDIEGPTSGTVLYRGQPLEGADPRLVAQYRDEVTAVFQNPFSSMSPRRRLWDIVTERSAIKGGAKKSERRARAEEVLAQVGLAGDYLDRYPHQLSGGQRQRVAIARAISENPQIIILDEPMSALDVSVSAQVANLLLELQERLEVAYLFVGHDMQMIRHLCHDVYVMERGRVVESGPAKAVMDDPQEDYTRRLVAASQLRALPGRGPQDLEHP